MRSVHFVSPGSGVIFTISVNQMRILFAFAASDSSAGTEELYQPVFGLPNTRQERRRKNKTATPSQRPSLCRSLRRLEKAGFITTGGGYIPDCPNYKIGYRLTDQGKLLVEDLRTLTNFKPLPPG
jgi:hypothetical protein